MSRHHLLPPLVLGEHFRSSLAVVACAGGCDKGEGDERATVRNGDDARFRPMQARPAHLRGALARRYRAAVRAAIAHFQVNWNRRQQRTRSYPPPCGEGRPPKRSEGGRGGGRAVMRERRLTTATPTPSPSPQGEGSTPSGLHDSASSDARESERIQCASPMTSAARDRFAGRLRRRRGR
jgi:hypothetical protein